MPRAGRDLRVLVLEGFREGLPLYGEHPCSCKVLKSNYSSNSYCKATHSHHCFCVEGNPDICREH